MSQEYSTPSRMPYKELTDDGRSVLARPGASNITLRPATAEDAPAMLRLMDIATDWLVKKGQTGQWGTDRPSDSPRRIKQVTEFIASGGTWIAMESSWSQNKTSSEGEDGELAIINGVVGALSVGQASPYIPKATEPELYITFFITDRTSSRKGVGTILLEQARKLAREAEISLLRLDCYAGGSGGLVRYYESQGFQRGDTFEMDGWPGQILMQRLDQSTDQNSLE